MPRNLFLSLTAATLALGGEFRDPQGRFSINLPQGWNVQQSAQDVYFMSGSAYALAHVVPGGGMNPSLVAGFTDQFGSQWRNYRRLQAGTTQVGGSSGAFAIYAGTTPRGGDSVLKALSAPLGQDAFVLVISSPVQEWGGRKGEFDQLEQSLRLGRAGGAPPRGEYRAPAGQQQPQYGGSQSFSVVGRAGRVGQALLAQLPNGSGRQTFQAAFHMTSSIFDGQPRILGAFGDPGDREVQAFFRASHRGLPVKGWMAVGGGRAVVAFDEETMFSRSLPQLMQALGAGDGGETAPGRPVAPVQLRQQPFADGSGSIGLAPGWQTGDSGSGIVGLNGPNGAMAVFGFFQQVPVTWSGQIPNTPGFFYGPMRDAATALRSYFDAHARGGISRGQVQFRVVEGTQIPPLTAGGNAAVLLVEVGAAQGVARSLALVSVTPVDNERWVFYMTQMAAPKADFHNQLPVMMQMWNSWSLNKAMLQERMQSALRSMKETYSILQGANANAQTATSRSSLAWSQVLRGVTTIENQGTGRRGDLDTNYAERVVQGLNEQGYNYRIVPYQELIP